MCSENCWISATSVGLSQENFRDFEQEGFNTGNSVLEDWTGGVKVKENRSQLSGDEEAAEIPETAAYVHGCLCRQSRGFTGG